jgi:hypothetical protein
MFSRQLKKIPLIDLTEFRSRKASWNGQKDGIFGLKIERNAAKMLYDLL